MGISGSIVASELPDDVPWLLMVVPGGPASLKKVVMMCEEDLFLLVRLRFRAFHEIIS